MAETSMVPMRWPEDLLAAVDDDARREGENRSEWVRRAALQRLRGNCPSGHVHQLRIGDNVFCNDCGREVPPPLVALTDDAETPAHRPVLLTRPRPASW